MSCVFCEIVAGRAPAQRVGPDMANTVAFRPLGPVNASHTLVVPRAHVATLLELPQALVSPVFNHARMVAADLVAEGWDGVNVIQSSGRSASQTVMHLHVHVVGRRAGEDRLPEGWPWQWQERPALSDPVLGHVHL